MKTITILSLAVALTGIAAAETPAATVKPAQTAPAAAPAAEAPAQQAAPAKAGATKQEAETLLKEMMSTLGDLSATLEGVTDRATADAAAPKVTEMAAAVQALQAKAEEMGEPSPEVQQEIMQQYSKQLEETVGKFMQVSMKIGMANFFGSETLSKAFQSMGASLSGDDADEAQNDQADGNAPAPAPAAAPAAPAPAPESK